MKTYEVSFNINKASIRNPHLKVSDIKILISAEDAETAIDSALHKIIDIEYLNPEQIELYRFVAKSVEIIDLRF